jgi:hypothetical protein
MGMFKKVAKTVGKVAAKVATKAGMGSRPVPKEVVNKVGKMVVGKVGPVKGPIPNVKRALKK